MKTFDLSLPGLPGANMIETAIVRDFYDRALCSALATVARRPHPGPGFLWDPDKMCRFAEALARRAAERRFGVKLVLPGDGD